MKKEYKTNISQFYVGKTKTDFPKSKIVTSRDAEIIIRQFYHEDIGIYESFFVLFMNRANITTGFAKISQGGCAGCVADVKIIAKYVSDTLADSIVIAHNHPSGNLNPSNEDINITKKIFEAMKFLDCRLLDHIILTEESYYSFCDEGKM